MNPFQSNVDDGSIITQPFQSKKPVIDRKFYLYDREESRTLDKSSVTQDNKLGTFYGAEPEQVQRVTTNLMAIDENIAMQVSAFLIYTDATDLEIDKGCIALDTKTEKSYKILSFYRTGNSYKLMVTELDD